MNPSKMINENHNHADITRDGVLHRKGATPALKGQFGIIPANMRDGVWITKGLGNDEYLNSASHGAGRKMSRSAARRRSGARRRRAGGSRSTTCKRRSSLAPRRRGRRRGRFFGS